MAREQCPPPQVVAAHVGGSQFAICTFGKFDVRKFTWPTRGLHLDMLFFRVGPFGPINFTIST